MARTDISERGLETLIVTAMTGQGSVVVSTDESAVSEDRLREGTGYVLGNSQDYDRGHALDIAKLFEFLEATQPQAVVLLGIAEEGPKRQKFLARLQGEISRRGTIDVLRKGIKHGPASMTIFYASPTPGNRMAEERYAANIFSVTRQLRYSNDKTQLALDLCLFINGLPIATFELKNRLTKQTVDDAVQQYKHDRNPRELLFQFGRCVVHFAVDDQEVRMCTHLEGERSWFLPFNKGWEDGAGNPPNEHGLKTEYLWQEVLTRRGLTDILENYAQITEKKDLKTGRTRRNQIFPRYHQLEVVRLLLERSQREGVGHHYLIQHSAGSGKSFSIAWLSQQLIGLERMDGPVFDSIIVVTDRRVLDKQIRDTIKQFQQVAATVGHASSSSKLRELLASGKKVIITTVQKFPYVLELIGDEHRGRKFAIIIDEAHSSQGGRISAKMHMALSPNGDADEDTIERIINHIMDTRQMLPNASYFAFTATPKNRTLEIFGERYTEGDEVKRRPVHSYTMKQATQEGFILDVLKQYTPVETYYRLIKTVEDDPVFDRRKAESKLRRYAESAPEAIEAKAEVMVDHFHQQVIARRKVGGEARAMVVTNGISDAVHYYFAIRDYLVERKSPWKALVAFSGEHTYAGQKVTESSLNGFSSSLIPDNFSEDSYRFLVVADKFQTGYDEPLLHTMYVDKVLSGVRAVQTLSRLNRAHPDKHDTFVLDFRNDPETIQRAFEPYYRTTLLSGESDPDKLHDLKADLDEHQVFSMAQVSEVVELYLGGADRKRLDPILDACVAVYNEHLEEDDQVDFKGKAKAFVRTYNFLATILSFTNAEWEMLSTFLNFLIPKLPAPRETDLSAGILETVALESYRAEVQASLALVLADQDGEITPAPSGSREQIAEPELDKLSNILRTFNDLFGKDMFRDPDKVGQIITQELPNKVATNRAYQNARVQGDPQKARSELVRALWDVMTDMIVDQTELYRQFSDNQSFQQWLVDSVFWLTYEQQARAAIGLSTYPVEQARSLVESQFGNEAKWARINSALWQYFETRHGELLGLSGVRRIASSLAVSVDDVLSVMTLLNGPREEFLRHIYYRRVAPGQYQTVPVDEIRGQTRRWWVEKAIDEQEWRGWATNILVGWEPAMERGIA